MLLAVAIVTEDLGRWHLFDVPVDHALDPGCLLLPAHLITLGCAGVDDLSHPRLAVMNVELVGRSTTLALEISTLEGGKLPQLVETGATMAEGPDGRGTALPLWMS